MRNNNIILEPASARLRIFPIFPRHGPCEPAGWSARPGPAGSLGRPYRRSSKISSDDTVGKRQAPGGTDDGRGQTKRPADMANRCNGGRPNQRRAIWRSIPIACRGLIRTSLSYLSSIAFNCASGRSWRRGDVIVRLNDRQHDTIETLAEYVRRDGYRSLRERRRRMGLARASSVRDRRVLCSQCGCRPSGNSASAVVPSCTARR